MSLSLKILHALPAESGPRLKAARIACGLTQVDAAEATGLTQSYLSGLEAGRYPNSRLRTAHKLARLYRVPVDLLFPAEEEA